MLGPLLGANEVGNGVPMGLTVGTVQKSAIVWLKMSRGTTSFKVTKKSVIGKAEEPEYR